VRENDNNPINCSSVAPKDSYYIKNDSDNKIHYYKCIDVARFAKVKILINAINVIQNIVLMIMVNV
jgi:hypothetical protein